MRRFLCCTVLRWSLTLAGLAAATVALAAWHLGLDNNPVMGPRRALLLLVGLGTLSFAHRSRIAELLRRGRQRLDGPVRTNPPPSDRFLTEPHGTGLLHSPRPPGATFFVTLPAVFSILLWIFTAGRWTSSPGWRTYYYDMLAEAFASGHTFLNQVPDPRLAQLPNPYDPVQRAGIARCSPDTIRPDCFPLDVSYFNGKYYLYWGPAPAVVLALFKRGGLGRVGDNTIALAGAGSLFVFLALGLVDLWRRYFAHLPRWLLVPPLVLAGLAYPLPWVVDTPLIYEAAILQGAAFFAAGLALGIPVLATGDRRPWRLALVGVLWSLSFGSRIVLALPIVVLAGGMTWRLYRRSSADSQTRSLWKPLLALALPLVATAFLLGAYNFARFSDPLESGWRYALAGSGVQFAGLSAVFNGGNILANAYNYLLASVSISGEFPFLEPLRAKRVLGPIEIPHPGLFHAEYVTGLLIATPFLVFALYLLWVLACGASDCNNSRDAQPSLATLDQPGLRQLIWPLCLAGVTAFLPILSLYAVTARYLLDVLPFLTILAALGAWTAYDSYARTSLTRLVIGAAILATAGVSTIISVLLALNNLSR